MNTSEYINVTAVDAVAGGSGTVVDVLVLGAGPGCWEIRYCCTAADR